MQFVNFGKQGQTQKLHFALHKDLPTAGAISLSQQNNNEQGAFKLNLFSN